MFASVGIELPHNFSASAHIGHQEIDESTDYTDWSVGVGYNWQEFDFNLSYTDTDLNQSDLDKGRAVFGISKSF